MKYGLFLCLKCLLVFAVIHGLRRASAFTVHVYNVEYTAMLMQHTWILKSNRSKATMIQMICSTDTPTQYYIKNVYQ